MRDKVVLITGGSAGLGRSLALAWAAAGAKVAIVGRDHGKLDQVVTELRSRSADAEGFAADVTDDQQVATLFQRVHDRFQRLDALVNNVGISMRGHIADTTPQQFQQLWETNFLSAVRCTRAALPEIFKSRGHLVFIGSLGSKVASRHLGAYPATKFAIAAYAHQLRLELSPLGVHTLLVCPGPIRRDDAGVRYAQQAHDLPESARQPGGGVKLRGISPDDLAGRIVRACERRQAELVVPAKARLLFAIAQLFPSLGDWIIRKKT